MYLMLLPILIIAAITDFRSRIIPNWLTLPAIVGGLAYHAAVNGLSGFIFGLEGVLLGFALLILFYLAGGMGAGDVKLLGAVKPVGPERGFPRFPLYGNRGRNHRPCSSLVERLSDRDDKKIHDDSKNIFDHAANLLHAAGGKAGSAGALLRRRHRAGNDFLYFEGYHIPAFIFLI